MSKTEKQVEGLIDALLKYARVAGITPGLKNWINTTLRKHLTDQLVAGSSISTLHDGIGNYEHLIDYLSSPAGRKKRLKKMTVHQCELLAKKWIEKGTKICDETAETEEDIETIIDFGDGFKLVKLLSERAYKREGALMSHCIAGYYGREGSDNFSIRDKHNRPHSTMEVTYSDDGTGARINQIKGKGNGHIHPKYIRYVLDTLVHFNLPVRPHDLENLGYINLAAISGVPEVNEIAKKEFGDRLKWLQFGGVEYLYKQSLENAMDEVGGYDFD